ncbi:MAG: hypothetical protein R2911_32255 [Caldilineaceae bacterium]
MQGWRLSMLVGLLGRVGLAVLVTLAATGLVNGELTLGGSISRIAASDRAHLQSLCPTVTILGAVAQITPTATATLNATSAASTATATPTLTFTPTATPTNDPCATPTTEPTPPPPPTPCPEAAQARTGQATVTPTSTAVSNNQPTATPTATPTLDPCATPAFTPPPPATATSCPPAGAPTATSTSTSTATPTTMPTATEPGTTILPTFTPTPPPGATATSTNSGTLPTFTPTLTPTSSVEPCAATPAPSTTAPATPTLVGSATATPVHSAPPTATPTINAAGGALFILKDGPAVVAAATPITYTLRIQNSGAATLTGLEVYDELPANAQYVVDSGGVLERSGETAVVRWSVPGLAVGGQTVVSFSVLAARDVINDQYGVTTQGGLSSSGHSAVLTLVSSDVQQAQMPRASGGTLTSADTNIQITFLPNTTDEDVTVTLVKAETLLNSSGFAGLAFDIAAANAQGQAVTEFNTPFQLVVHYQDADWQNAGITDEAQLNLYFWRNGAWEALLPCNSCSHDKVNNLFAVTLNHLTLFALRVDPPEVWLPLIRR